MEVTMLTLSKTARLTMCALVTPWTRILSILCLSSVLMGQYSTRRYLSVTGGLMWTVEQQLVFMVQWRELLDLLKEQEDKVMEMLEPVLLQVEDLKKNVLKQCLTAGVQDREIQTVLTMVSVVLMAVLTLVLMDLSQPLLHMNHQ